jgi:hypothetical protein
MAIDRGRAKGSSSAEPRRRGRPPGSVSLTDEIQSSIVSLARGGVLPTVAARAAGINPRTYHDWMARGQDRHRSRPNTPKLKAFAKAVDRAAAEAIAAAEASLHRDHPDRWLNRAAPAGSEEVGGPESLVAHGPQETSIDLSRWSDEELMDETQQLLQAVADDWGYYAPRCSDKKCPCEHHVPRSDRRKEA